MKKLICAAAILALVFCLLPAAALAAPTDEIENYTVTVNIEQDGTMDLTYHIDWKVLDSTSEGPLTWVKVGIPNSSVDNLKSLGSSITGISYLGDGGDYVRLDLDRSYNAGETVPLDFSIHQSNMADASGSLISYRFTPGWFDGIEEKPSRSAGTRTRFQARIPKPPTTARSSGRHRWLRGSASPWR